ncbi:unnamed protein product [Rotaria sordida]|uniref:Uncharacterized protein n=1 Tax=Rotaria sordida TaxID=392033 RepID=A0A814F053_9BILA|nr:unnamed protein product [Rotaria sordida]
MVYSCAYIPYITCSGNHENAYKFSQYVTKFSMTSSHIIHMVVMLIIFTDSSWSSIYSNIWNRKKRSFLLNLQIFILVYNGTFGAYIDPDASVHIIIGSACCNEHHDPFGIP